MAVGDAGLYGHFRYPAARHWQLTVASDRSLLVFLVIVAAVGLLASAGIRHSRLGRAFVADRRQRRCRALAGHRCRTLQARGVSHLSLLCRPCRIAVCACRWLRQPGGLRAAHGRARVHHALYWGYRHHNRRCARCADRNLVAGDISNVQRISGSRLWRGPNRPPDLCARRPRGCATGQGGAHDHPASRRHNVPVRRTGCA